MSTTASPFTPAPAIACAVIYAGTDMLLAIESRPGRFPVSVTNTDMPRIEWVASDGVHEHIELEGETAAADHRNLRHDLEQGELLIAEVVDPADPLLQNPTYHLLSLPAQEPKERCS